MPACKILQNQLQNFSRQNGNIFQLNLLEVVVEVCGNVSRVLELKFLGDNLSIPGHN